MPGTTNGSKTMFYKYVRTVYGWTNTGITAYGERPAGDKNTAWMHTWEVVC